MWLLTSLAIAPQPTDGDVAAELRADVAQREHPDVVPGDGANAQPDSMQPDGCGNWRLTAPEHCRWIYRAKIDDYLACIRVIGRACEERADSKR